MIFVCERKIDDAGITTTRDDICRQKRSEKLTLQQREEFAAQYNGGLGSGMTPAEYKAKYGGGLPDDSQK